MQLPTLVLYNLAFTPQVDGLIIKATVHTTKDSAIHHRTKNEHWRFVCYFGGLAHENDIIHVR